MVAFGGAQFLADVQNWVFLPIKNLTAWLRGLSLRHLSDPGNGGRNLDSEGWELSTM